MQSHLLEQTQELVFGISISSPRKGLQGKVSEQMLHQPGSENQELKILWLSCWSWSWPPMSNITARPYFDHRLAQSSRSCCVHLTPRSPTPFMAESNTTPVREKQGGLVSGWSISWQINSILKSLWTELKPWLIQIISSVATGFKGLSLTILVCR